MNPSPAPAGQVMMNRKTRQEFLIHLYWVNQVGGPLQYSKKLAMFCQIISKDQEHPIGATDLAGSTDSTGNSSATGRGANIKRKRKNYGLREIPSRSRGWLQHICAFLSEEAHHPGYYSDFGSFYCCCENGDKNSRGCQSGEIRHHPGEWLYYYGGCSIYYDDLYWTCCDNTDLGAPGCQPGPHPNPFC